MWNPGFSFTEAQIATLAGFHRAPCIYSWVHRGTPQRPGIVLGLAPGGSCIGMAFKVEAEQREATLDYLRARELVTNVYVEMESSIELQNGRTVDAVTYVADTQHEQYAGQLTHDALVRQITGAVGKSGKNEDYIRDTARKLLQMEIDDPLMQKLHASIESNQR